MNEGFAPVANSASRGASGSAESRSKCSWEIAPHMSAVAMQPSSAASGEVSALDSADLTLVPSDGNRSFQNASQFFCSLERQVIPCSHTQRAGYIPQRAAARTGGFGELVLLMNAFINADGISTS